jgi:formylglycine-generating enzyme required for sulfatase activity
MLITSFFCQSYLQAQTDCFDNAVPTIQDYLNRGETDKAKDYIRSMESLCDGIPSSSFKQIKEKVYNYRSSSTTSASHTTYTETVAGVSFKLVAIPGGTFSMGSNDGESDERPVHSVSLSAYYMGETEVTQALWQAVMGTNPSYHKNCDQCPVEQVSWNEAQEFINKLNQKTGKRYRLPTEAEWEYGARGGEHYTYAGSNSIDGVAWYYDKSGSQTHPVKQKRANGYGLYDMSGNVYEWCTDWYASDYYSKSPDKNPEGPSAGNNRVLRGGSWDFSSEFCRVANRYYDNASRIDIEYGLRLAVSGP